MNIQSKERLGKSSRQQQAEARRDSLIDTALELFAEQGYSATSIKQIAARAGVAIGLLYHYFPSKSAVMTAVMQKHGFLPDLRALLLLGEDQIARRVLVEVAQEFSSLFARKEPVFRLVVSESQTNPEVAQSLNVIISEGMLLLSAYLDGRVQAGELRPHNTQWSARMLLGSVLATHIARLPAPDWDEFVTMLLDGIAVPPVTESKKEEHHVKSN